MRGENAEIKPSCRFDSFINYKGPGKMQSEGFGGVAEARDIIEAAAKAYREEISTTYKGKEQ